MKPMLRRKQTILPGLWLSAERVEASIENLLFQMLEPTQPNSRLRQAVIEELHRRAKHKDVVLEYLDLEEVGTDQEGDIVLHIVAPRQEQTPWEDALLFQRGACPIGFVFNSCDHGRVTVVHNVFRQLTASQKALIRTYAALAVHGKSHEKILAVLCHGEVEADHYRETVREARRRLQTLDRSVLFSHDGNIRVQVGSLSQTAKNILREGIKGEYLFILPKHLFEGRINYIDVEFIVYLNFFVLHGMRTRIAGMATQKEALERLLTLTIYGIFNPQAVEPPSFAALQRTYGVPDLETFAFLRMCYERYSTRRDAHPTGAILGIDAYVDFIVLNEEEQPTPIPIKTPDEHGTPSHAGIVRVVPHRSGSFDVRITQANGRSTAKDLTVRPPARVVGSVPEAFCHAIQFATDRPRFGVTPLGTSHGFDPAGDLTSFVLWINGKGILIDPSPEALGYLEYIGVAQTDLLYVFLTHVHADHDGGLIEKLLSDSRTTIIASEVVFQLFVKKAQFVTGHDFEQEGLVQHVAANPGVPVRLEVAGEHITLETRWNLHPIPTNGFKMTVGGTCFGYSGDTQYAPDLIRQLQREQQLPRRQAEDLLYFFWTPDGQPMVDLLYHEAGIPPIHTDRRQLERLPEAMKARTALVHIADRDVPPGAPPGKPPLFVTHTLLPPTDQSRRGVLLSTLALVHYLYDVPTETLEGLVDRATMRVFEGGDVIIRQGPVPKGELLSFFVVADGEVAVKNGRRLIIKLIKTDTFGEWGISHQRGFRSADVVASRRTQLLEFDEQAYRWMVARHPVIQERIGRIRALLPRLQLTQARTVQLTQDDPQRTRSVIEEMTTSQLSAFAVFSEVKQFSHGMPVVLEGEVANGWYILLSGHLTVNINGNVVSELSEGDVFGEVGLIEGGKRTATIRVVSADAEVLSMSQQSFETLLQTVPAFSFGIRATAAQRQEINDTWRTTAP